MRIGIVWLTVLLKNLKAFASNKEIFKSGEYEKVDQNIGERHRE